MFTRSWLVRLPSGSPVLFLPESKLATIPAIRATIRLSGMRPRMIFIITSWSIEAKNLRISHFNIHTVFAWSLDAREAYIRNWLSALCVPFLSRQEYESEINVQSKNG